MEASFWWHANKSPIRRFTCGNNDDRAIQMNQPQGPKGVAMLKASTFSRWAILMGGWADGNKKNNVDGVRVQVKLCGWYPRNSVRPLEVGLLRRSESKNVRVSSTVVPTADSRDFRAWPGKAQIERCLMYTAGRSQGVFSPHGVTLWLIASQPHRLRSA